MGVSSIGVGSGLDVESIITQMVAIEKQSVTTLQTKAETIQSKISAYGQIKSLVDDLNSAVRDLTLDSGFSSVKINSSNSSAVSATMTGLASAGSYNIAVQNLAQSQTSVSEKLNAGDKVNAAGVMRFVLGNSTNTSATLTTVDLNISATDTLTDIVAKINGDSALGKSVIASVITDSAGKQQLMVRSRETGLDNQFSMTVGSGVYTEAEATAANDPALAGTVKAAVAGSNLAKLAVTQTQAAQNATMTLNGVQLESNTNTFKDIVPGLSINVSQANSTSLLTLNQDKDATQEKIQKFVDAYNAVNELLSASTKYDSESGSAGILQGDSSTVSLQNSLRMLTQSIVGNTTGAFTRLSDIGIQMEQGGKLSVNTTKLTTALEDMDAVKSLFSTKANSLGTGGGIAVNFKTLTDSLLAWEGALNNKTDSLEGQLESNQKQQDKVNTRAEAVEARLRTQYTALDTKMASLNSLSSYVEQMVKSWNKSDD